MTPMDEQLRVFLATIYGEAAGSSPAAWKAIAHTMFNRVGFREWRDQKTVLRVIANTGFDAFTRRNAPYNHAYDILENVDTDPEFAALPPVLAHLCETVIPVYCERLGRPSGLHVGQVLYYSPKAQASLHASRPDVYKADRPYWAKSPELEVVDCRLAPGDDFIFFRYKD